MAEPALDGHWVPAWAAVVDTFRANLVAADDDPGDLGAALCVMVDGEVVVDLWGGWADRQRTRPWTRDTLVNAYSVGKGISASIALAALSAGVLELDAPLRDVWPELAADTTFRDVLAHRAGLPALRNDAPADLPLDWHAMCSALAATDPWWEPGSAHGYHTNTFGYLVGEPLRRAADAERFGDLVQRWFPLPAGADVYFGVPASEHGRCADVELAAQSSANAPRPGEQPTRGGPADMVFRSYYNPPSLSGLGILESADWRSAEVPSTNGHATAGGVARVYAAVLDPRGPVDPVVLAEATTTQSEGHDLVLGKPSRFGLGYQLHEDHRPVGVTQRSFGHFGFGGSLGFGDPVTGMAVGYVLNRPGDRWQIPRTKRLVAALREVVS